MNLLRTKYNQFYFKTQFVPRRKHHLGYKTSQLMQLEGIVTVCSEIHTKHMYIACIQKVESLNVQPSRAS